MSDQIDKCIRKIKGVQSSIQQFNDWIDQTENSLGMANMERKIHTTNIKAKLKELGLRK